MHDIEVLKTELQTMSPEQLIAAFKPDGPKRYGGYDYYYNDMANRAIRDELENRGAAALPVLKKHDKDSTNLWQGINGPGFYTIGYVCRELIQQLDSVQTSAPELNHTVVP